MYFNLNILKININIQYTQLVTLMYEAIKDYQ
jgi:hypothetical protein